MNLVILDRDGVVNEALVHQVRSADEWRPIPGSLDAVARLSRAGCRVVVATGQPGIRRRELTFEDLNRIHERMHRQLSEFGGVVDAVFTCLCLPGSRVCKCFAPRGSVLHAIADRMRLSLEGVPYISDTPERLEAASAALARPMLIRAGGTAASRHGAPDPDRFEVHADLASAVEALLAAP